jgi:hypothetical protein
MMAQPRYRISGIAITLAPLQAEPAHSSVAGGTAQFIQEVPLLRVLRLM